MNAIQPLTPADCDLRDFRRLPFDVVRVLDSDTFALLDAVDFKASFALWCKAWHQVPAASLPDDDRVLARLACLSLSDWQAARPRVLASWRLCTDGRFYHPVVAEMALEALLERIDAALKGGAGNARRWGSAYDRDGMLTRRLDVAARLLALNPSAKIKQPPGERKLTNDRTATENDRTATPEPSPRIAKPSQPNGNGNGNGIDSDSSLRSESESVESLTRAGTAFDRKTWFETLAAAAGPGLADPAKAPSLITGAAELDAWANAGVDLTFDAVPTIVALTAKARADPIASWGWFRRAVLKAHATRTADLAADLANANETAKAEKNARSERPPSRNAESASALDGVLKTRKAREGRESPG